MAGAVQLCPNAAAEAATEMEEEEEAEETLARRDDITAERRLEQRNERRELKYDTLRSVERSVVNVRGVSPTCTLPLLIAFQTRLCKSCYCVSKDLWKR